MMLKPDDETDPIQSSNLAVMTWVDALLKWRESAADQTLKAGIMMNGSSPSAWAITWDRASPAAAVTTGSLDPRQRWTATAACRHRKSAAGRRLTG